MGQKEKCWKLKVKGLRGWRKKSRNKKAWEQNYKADIWVQKSCFNEVTSRLQEGRLYQILHPHVNSLLNSNNEDI